MLRLETFFCLTILVILLTGVSCTQTSNAYEDTEGQISGSGILVSEARDLGYFNEIHSSGPVTTVISQGDTKELLVTADDNVIQKVQTTVHGNALYISLKDGSYHNIWIRVKVVVPAITYLGNSGTGSMKVTTISNGGELRAVNSGIGQMILEGRGRKATLVNEGSGTINAFNFETTHCTVNNEGSGDCEINCSILLDGRNIGSGNIRYLGDPTVTIENTGAGEIIHNGS